MSSREGKWNCQFYLILFFAHWCEKFSFDLKEFYVFKREDSVASGGTDWSLGKVWVTPAFAQFLLFLRRPGALVQLKCHCGSNNFEYFSTTRQFLGWGSFFIKLELYVKKQNT